MNTDNHNDIHDVEFLLKPNQEVIVGQFIEINPDMENLEAGCNSHCASGTCMVG